MQVGVTAQEVRGLANAFKNYEIQTDEEVAMQAKSGCEVAQEYLITKYRNFVKAKARSYFLIGADREDIIQEGMIGLI
jgi:RNA polymerase sporulation-specific sigma factor